MPVLTTPQGPNWDSNVYVVATTRIFILMGTAYLVRTLYNLVSPAWGSRAASTVAATMDGLGLEEIISDTLATGSGAPGTEPDLEASLTLGVQLPQRSYDPQHQAQIPQASPRAYDQPVGAPVPAVAADAIPEQDVGVRSDGAQDEEGSEISVGLVN